MSYTTRIRGLFIIVFAFVAAQVFAQGTAGPCDVFPADNPWNVDVSQFPVHPQSTMFVESIDLGSTSKRVHPDFGTNPEYGIPYVYVSAAQARVQITYDAYGNESDRGPFPIPPDAPVEGGNGATGDRHVLAIDTTACMLYELFAARKDASGDGWTAESGAVFDLKTTAYRQDGWTSADAAGLPIFPGLVRYDEVAEGAINHAVRFTSRYSQRGWIHPARHHAGRADTTYPPMGLRMRLRNDYDISAITGQARIIVQALKKYGMILADNGTSWFISGTSDPRWDPDDLNQLKRIPGTAFEAVFTGPIKRSPEISSIRGDEAMSPLQSFIVRVVDGSVEAMFTTAHAALATTTLYDVRGSVVATGEQALSDAGTHTIRMTTSGLAAGVYLCRLQTGTHASVARVVFVR
ncbi:MAG: hypothetical protein H7X80_01485 [bacterium]|nr:hypothetical protein [Candidatus Kapabacteria bacterium]